MAVANPAAIQAAGGDFTTIQAWEDVLVNNENILVGECAGEAFTTALFNGITYDSTNYPHLTCTGNEHDGRAHEVSAAGNARIEHAGAASTLGLFDSFVRVSWMEIKGPGNNAFDALVLNFIATGTSHIHHCIIHNNEASNSVLNNGIYSPDVDLLLRGYRNVIYGMGASGARVTNSNASSYVRLNTIYECNFSENTFRGGIRIEDVDVIVTANGCFDNFHKDIFNTTGTLDWNYTADDTGDDEGANGVANLTTANQFDNATTTFANTDLTHKAGGDILEQMAAASLATIFGASYLTDFPEIDVPITQGASRTQIGAGRAWDIGADQLVMGAVGGGGNRRRRLLIAGAA